MDNVKIVYKILKALEEAMDYEEFDSRRISAERLGVSEMRLLLILKAMKDKGLIEGISFEEDVKGNLYPTTTRIRITMDGMEYMSENSTMQRVTKTLKGIKDSIPGA